MWILAVVYERVHFDGIFRSICQVIPKTDTLNPFVTNENEKRSYNQIIIQVEHESYTVKFQHVQSGRSR